MSPDLLDVCILFSRFARGDEKISKCITALKRNNSFDRFCSFLKLNQDIFLNLLRLTFNKIDQNSVNDVLMSINVQQYCDIGILRSIMSISKGYVNRDIFD